MNIVHSCHGTKKVRLPPADVIKQNEKGEEYFFFTEYFYLKSAIMVARAITMVRISMTQPPKPRRRWAAGLVNVLSHL